MSWLYRRAIRPVLFTQDSEQIHNRVMKGLGWASHHELVCEALATFFTPPPLPIEVFGLRFPNPVGLAAGMDKAAEAVPAWAALGFGFSELGAVTWHPQPGNPSPRLFRAISEEALINRMGFNNPGAEAVAQTLVEWRATGRWPRHPVGVNLGKSKITPFAQAAEDYVKSLRVLWPHLDFFVVNVSSPNTPNLRELQDKAALDEILAGLQEVNQSCTVRSSSAGTKILPKPILVKVAPDLSFEALDEILSLVEPRQVAGLVATNTTVTRPQTNAAGVQRIYAETGGLSGRPLRSRSTEVIRHLFRESHGAVPIIGVGGIFDANDAWEKVAAGASLVQIYTGLVYEGPAVAANIVNGLIQHLTGKGIKSLTKAVGCST